MQYLGEYGNQDGEGCVDDEKAEAHDDKRNMLHIPVQTNQNVCECELHATVLLLSMGAAVTLTLC
jgi:hypothetical protein